MRFWVILFFFLMSSCQQHHFVHETRTPVRSAYKTLKDGAPSGPVPTKFKEIKPKNEPLSRYGNPDSYRVNGHQYQVMTTAHGYRARGLASWYGTKFHAKKTSSGENYDMYALTAAHKTLPLPTYIRVKNLSNGYTAIVKVNDRGPFHSNRILDLSYGAAVKLGLFPKGTALVEVEALKMNTPGQSHVAQYYLQAGAFASPASARALRTKLAKLTPARVFVESYKKRYLVKMGPFKNKVNTDHAKMILQKQGLRGVFSFLQ